MTHNQELRDACASHRERAERFLSFLGSLSSCLDLEPVASAVSQEQLATTRRETQRFSLLSKACSRTTVCCNGDGETIAQTHGENPLPNAISRNPWTIHFQNPLPAPIAKTHLPMAKQWIFDSIAKRHSADCAVSISRR